MELQHLDQGVRRFIPVHTAPVIACCNCGKPMKSDSSLAMCDDCVRLSVDITEGIPKSGNLIFCKNCERLLIPPNNWIYAPRESRELLGAMLKRLKGLSKLRLIDAKFLWTEPHSRRTKVNITVQGEAIQFQNTLIQQDFVVEFVENTGQCGDCAKSFTANTWQANIQIRQKVTHKKTFFYLEQLILKHKAHKNTVTIQESKEGLDFFYNQRNHAIKMMDFLNSVIPIRSKKSEELVSQDTHTGAKSFKFSFSVEIVPICKEDLVVLPKKLARSLGNISQLVLCYRIANTVHLIDPTNLQTTELIPSIYWRTPFPALASSSTMSEYMVLDIEPAGTANDRFALADATVARTADLGKNDVTYYVRTHLGGILHPGDLAMGFHLTNTNFNNKLWDDLDKDKIPEVILVKKSYSDKPRKARNWKLKRIAKEYNEQPMPQSTGVRAKASDAFERSQRDYDEFLQELEEDKDFRSEINIYKGEGIEEQDEDSDDADSVDIKLSELKVDDDDDDEEGGNEEDRYDEHGEE